MPIDAVACTTCHKVHADGPDGLVVREAAAINQISAGTEGEALFRFKGCEGCHAGKLALARRLKDKTLTDIAAAMWNHQLRVAATGTQLTIEEMREITSYLWATQFFEDAGDEAVGRRVFTAKPYVACHQGAASGTPQFAGRTFSGVTLVSRCGITVHRCSAR